MKRYIKSSGGMRDRFVNPDDFVFYYNGKKLYQGDGAGFAPVITKLCNDDRVNKKFQDWCNQFGDPFDFDGTPDDTAYVFTWLVGQEQLEDPNFYLDGGGLLSFEIFPASEDVTSSTRTQGKKSVTAARVSTDGLSSYTPWSGAVPTWDAIEEYDKIDTLEAILDEQYYNEELGEGIIDETELNDLLWHEPEWVCEMVGLYYDSYSGEISDQPFETEEVDD